MKQITIPIYLLYSLLIAILAISAIFYFGMEDGGQCLANPLTYGAEKVSTDTSGPVACSCTYPNPIYSNFIFDEKNITVLD